MDRCVIAGAGALGSFLAARLHTAGRHVLLLARAERLAVLAAEGVTIAQGARHEGVPVPVAAGCEGFGPADAVVLATKTGDLAAAMELVAPVVGPATALVTVQNGVEAPDEVAARFPGSPVIASRVHGFFEMDGPRVRHVGVEPSLSFGLATPGDPAPLDAFACLLGDAGITGVRSGDIRRDLWEKFVLASAIGGVGAAFGLPAGGLRSHPAAWDLLASAMAEVHDLAAARGVALGEDCVARTLAFAASFPADATSSLQRDLEAGRPSEYGAITGATIRMAARAGMPVPAHARIEAMIRARGLLPADQGSLG